MAIYLHILKGKQTKKLMKDANKHTQRNNITNGRYETKNIRKKKSADYIYIYIYIYGEKLKNKVIQSEEFNMKESQCYNFLVLINHHLDLEKMLFRVVISSMDV